MECFGFSVWGFGFRGSEFFLIWKGAFVDFAIEAGVARVQSLQGCGHCLTFGAELP